MLQSVIKITEQRDVELLDRCLITTLAEHLPLKTITLFKLRSEVSSTVLDKIVSFSTQNKGNNGIISHWHDEPDINSTNKVLNACLSSQEIQAYQLNDTQHVHVYPIASDGNIIGVLEVSGQSDLSNAQALIGELSQIYGNCLFHINKSERDKLTGLLNRHSFDTKFKRLIKNQQDKQRLAFKQHKVNENRRLADNSYAWLAIFDIDHFKKVNDQFGHVCGDEVLLKLSQKMKSFFRNSDLLFRFGGEEFVVILEPIPYEMAERTLERFREKIEKCVFPLVNRITTSGGYIKITDADYPAAFIERADQALYYAKSRGRNNICNYELLVDSGELPKSKEIGAVDLF